jgi:FMN reductase (NADPH)/FMN reductase [NAD(P)H]
VSAVDASRQGPLSNETLELIARRRSTRVYDPTPLSADEKQAIAHAALRAPTGGNMVLYTIVEIEEQGLKDRLAVLCDDQPFIAKAPWVLLFAADWQKWTDLFAAGGAYGLGGVEHRAGLGLGDLLLACSDALIAAQNAVIAAESLGIGSCYIGDILENGEEVAELLALPPHTLPIAMVCFGRPRAPQEPIEHYGRHLLHTDRYRRLTSEELAEVADDLASLHAPHGLPPGAADYPQVVYRRKFASAFMREMNRSVAWWLERWQRE